MTLRSTEMSTRNISWDKGGRCVRPKTFSPSCEDCLEIWEPQPAETLRPFQGFLCFYFTFYVALTDLLLPWTSDNIFQIVKFNYWYNWQPPYFTPTCLGQITIIREIITRVIIIIIIIIIIIHYDRQTAVLDTSHIIRKVLQCETWSLSDGDHHYFRKIPGRQGLW
jgi:hypothetical protein